MEITLKQVVAWTFLGCQTLIMLMIFILASPILITGLICEGIERLWSWSQSK